MREYYDLWDQWAARLSPQGLVKERVRRRIIHAADTYFFGHHVTRLLTISERVKARLARWNKVDAEVLHPPPPQRDYRCDGYGDYLFFASRLTPLKRIDLVLRALAVPSAAAIRCVIGGDGEDRPRLTQLARDLGLEARVTFTGRLDDAGLLDHLARCRAVVFPPADEDYGFVTVEAFASGKAVVTCSDSGGPLEFIRHGENGLVVDPTPERLGDAFASVAADAGLAERMGGRARETVAQMTWPAAVKRLVL
jgi:glycosyltransferase involved in cell wall biosynthesis